MGSDAVNGGLSVFFSFLFCVLLLLHRSLRLPFAVDVFVSVRETGWASQLFFFLSTDRESC